MRSERFTPDDLTKLVASLIRGYTFRFKDEYALQRGIAEALDEAIEPGDEIQVEREHRLDARNRLDFLVTYAGVKVGIEVKVAGAASGVSRQVSRYLTQLDGLVLVTTRSHHRSVETVKTVTGKPLEIVWLGFSAF